MIRIIDGRTIENQGVQVQVQVFGFSSLYRVSKMRIYDLSRVYLVL